MRLSFGPSPAPALGWHICPSNIHASQYAATPQFISSQSLLGRCQPFQVSHSQTTHNVRPCLSRKEYQTTTTIAHFRFTSDMWYSIADPPSRSDQSSLLHQKENIGGNKVTQHQTSISLSPNLSLFSNSSSTSSASPPL